MDIQQFSQAIDAIAVERSTASLPASDAQLSSDLTDENLPDYVIANNSHARNISEINLDDFLRYHPQAKKYIDKEIASRMAVVPVMSDYDPKNEGYRRISGLGDQQRRTLQSVSQAKMYEVAYFMYTVSPLFKRLLDLDTEFLFGEPFRIESKNEVVQQVLDNFLEINKLQDNFTNYMKWLSALGEQCYPVEVNEIDGSVILKYIDPSTISEVYVEKDNVLNAKKIILNTKDRDGKQIVLDIIAKDYTDIESKTWGKLTGQCFFFTINHPPNSPRGISDYWTLFDYIDALERSCMQHMERIELMLNFIWDVTLENMSLEQIEAWQAKNPKPNPGSIRAHNEKVKWEAVAPSINSPDFAEAFEVMIGFIMGLRGRPRNWLGQGGKVYSQEADQQDQVPQKSFDVRQIMHHDILKTIFDFVIDQAIIHKTIVNKDRKDIEYKIIMPEISKKNFNKGIVSLPQLVTSLTLAVDNKLIDQNNARKIFSYSITQIGYELNSEEVKTAIEQAEKESGKNLASMFEYDKIDYVKKDNNNGKDNKTPNPSI